MLLFGAVRHAEKKSLLVPQILQLLGEDLTICLNSEINTMKEEEEEG